MLVEITKFEKDAVVSIKLQNGDEIIGKVVKHDDYGTITLSKPLKVDLVQGQDGRPALIMTPTWLLTGSQQDDSATTFRINSAHITTVMLSNKDARTNYTQQTSNLVIPGAGGGLFKP